LDYIQILQKPGGSLSDSFLEDGFILEKSFGVGQKRAWDHPSILIANTALDSDKIKIHSTRVRVDSIAKVAEIEEAEKQKMRVKVEKILNHKMNVFISRQLIYNYPEQLFTDAGVGSIEHADFEGVERLAAVLGGDIVSTFDSPETVRLGHCNKIDEIMIGEDKLIRFTGCAGGAACTIVLRGASSHLLAEAERSLHDALAVLQQTLRHPERTLGGGCAEMVMAEAVDELAPQVSGKKALAVSAFAEALRQMPVIISENAGLDGMELVSELRAAHHAGQHTFGLDM
jgi:T-complex protein 1 subunit beta